MKIKLIDIFIIVFFLLAVYFILTRIFGNSASDLSIMIVLFVALGGLLYRLNREFGEFKIKSIYCFKDIKKDMSLLRGDMGLIKDKLGID